MHELAMNNFELSPNVQYLNFYLCSMQLCPSISTKVKTSFQHMGCP